MANLAVKRFLHEDRMVLWLCWGTRCGRNSVESLTGNERIRSQARSIGRRLR